MPACLTRKLSRKKRCGGKLTGDQWSPLHTQQGKTCPSPPVPACGKGKLPRAHIECAPTDSVSDKGRKLRAGHRPLLAPSARGLCPQAVGERNVGRAGIFRAQTGENSCRGEHCSPVPACLTRKLSRKKRCGGKLTGDQWSPLHTQQGKRAPLRPHKNVGADSISARARLRKDKLPRAHIECAPRDSVFGQQGHPQKTQPRSFTVK